MTRGNYPYETKLLDTHAVSPRPLAKIRQSISLSLAFDSHLFSVTVLPKIHIFGVFIYELLFSGGQLTVFFTAIWLSFADYSVGGKWLN